MIVAPRREAGLVRRQMNTRHEERYPRAASVNLVTFPKTSTDNAKYIGNTILDGPGPDDLEGVASRKADMGGGVVLQRKIIVNIATSADGYVARPDGNLDWLTERPAPKGFYGLPEFERSTDAKILGRKTFDRSLEMGARFSAHAVHYVFSRRPPPASVPAGVHFVTEPIGAFVERLRTQTGKNVWMMGGGEIIASFLDEAAIDEFIITVVPTFIGKGIPLLAPRHREVPLRLLGVQQFPDGVVQLHYEVQRLRG